MELDPRNPLLTLTNYFCQGKSAEELKQMIVSANVELQTLRLQAQEEIGKRDDELRHFRTVLSNVVKERDEARDKFQRLLLEKFIEVKDINNHVVAVNAGGCPVSGVTSINNEEEVKKGVEFSNNGSDGDESIVSSPVVEPFPPHSFHEETTRLLLQENRDLPEKGKLLNAVMNAGPLLQTLLLAGPLPQWKHPPPPLESSQIPPVAIPPPLHPRDTLPCIGDFSTECGRMDRKRRFMEGSESSTKTKYHKILQN